MKKSFLDAMVYYDDDDGKKGRAEVARLTRVVARVASVMIMLLFRTPLLLSFRDLYLLFTSVLLPQFSCILLNVEFYRAASKRRSFSFFNLRMSFSFV